MLSLYIHIPFCVKKCHYCGFYSTDYQQALAGRFLDALSREIDTYRDLLRNRSFSTVYVGGGTPTTLSSSQLSRIFAIINDNLSLCHDAEITVEVNPAVGHRRVFRLLRDLGVTRVSIGVQSFSDEILAFLGRAHPADRAVAAVEDARDAGFNNISLDLLYGVPGQSAAQWEETLEQAFRLSPAHISAYGLSLDEGSRLSRDVRAGTVFLPDEEVCIHLYETVIEHATRAGYRHYEISNFSLPSYECRHNINYWDRGEYLGLGPGAYSFLGNRRYGNRADTEAYCAGLLQGVSVVDSEDLPSHAQAAAETLMLGLRKTEGIELQRFAHSFGEEMLSRLLERVHASGQHGLFRIEHGKLRLTRRGLELSNEAIARVMA
jgi:oxygen-independent coproporphyrinogen-3 oxidase